MKYSAFAPLACVALLLAGCGAAKPVSHAKPPATAAGSKNATPATSQAPSSQPTTTPASSPSTPPPDPMKQPQDGGISAALQALSHAGPVTQTTVADGVVLWSAQPGPFTAAFFNAETGKWVGVPLPFAANTFGRETSVGDLLFLSQGPMDDGSYSPFPLEELCIPQADGTFQCKGSSAYFPVDAPDVQFGSKPGQSLASAQATAQGMKFVFGNLNYADYLSVPVTTIHYDGAQNDLTLDFANTTLGSVGAVSASGNPFVQRVRIQSSGADVLVTIYLKPGANYYTGTINQAAGPTVFLELDFAGSPSVVPWGS